MVMWKQSMATAVLTSLVPQHPLLLLPLCGDSMSSSCATGSAWTTSIGPGAAPGRGTRRLPRMGATRPARRGAASAP